jgi:hypothetical protein
VLGAWGAACALLAGALVLLGFVRFQVDAYAELRTLPAPAGWQQWPVLPNLGGYSLDHDPGGCVGHGLLCGWTNVLLSEPGPWLRRGVSYGGSLNADPPSVRGSGTMRVVSAGSGVAIVAFEAGTTSGAIAFRHDGTWTIMAGLAAALVALLFAWLYASWRAVATRRFFDRARFVPGRRDASGTIRFEDETPPLVPDAATGVQASRARSSSGY